MRDVLALALLGADIEADAVIHGLHDLTQFAVALRPRAKLVILNSDFLCPLERACIETAAGGRVIFQ